MEHHIRALHDDLVAAGTFESARRYHVVWFGAVVATYAATYAVLLSAPGLLVRALAIVLSGVMVMQVGLFAHEVGHGAVTRSLGWRSVLGHFSNSFLVGFSFTYWQSTHSVHHNHPNGEGIDPDLESAGYALYRQSALRAVGVQRIVAMLQPWTVLVGFLGWAYSIKFDGLCYVIRNYNRRTAVDAACLVAHLLMWLALPMTVLPATTVLANYAVIMVLNGIYMAGILVVPHVGTGTEAPGERLSFFERQVRFSRNYDSSRLGTFLCGGLNLQIEHHLLPYVPCVRLRRARPVVAAYCAEHRLPYSQIGYAQAWSEVLSYLRGIAGVARSGRAANEEVAPFRVSDVV